jgi:hypothetical protein
VVLCKEMERWLELSVSLKVIECQVRGFTLDEGVGSVNPPNRRLRCSVELDPKYGRRQILALKLCIIIWKV